MSTPYEGGDILVPPQARGGRVTLHLGDEPAAYLPGRPAAPLRISSDRFGIEAGVDRREEDTEDTRARLRWNRSQRSPRRTTPRRSRSAN